MNPQQGEIYWVNISSQETQGSEQHGRRPFIVMSRNVVNNQLKTVLAVPMTTYQGQAGSLEALAKQPPYRIVVPVAEITKDPSCGSSLSIGVAKTDQARVIDKSRLEQRIGRLSQTAVISVGIGLAFVFDIR